MGPPSPTIFSHLQSSNPRPCLRDTNLVTLGPTLCCCFFVCYSFCFLWQEEKPAAGKKNPASRPLSMIIKVKPQAKKAKVDEGNTEEVSKAGITSVNDKSKPLEPVQPLNVIADKSNGVGLTGLVSYSDESDDDL